MKIGHPDTLYQKKNKAKKKRLAVNMRLKLRAGAETKTGDGAGDTTHMFLINAAIMRLAVPITRT